MLLHLANAPIALCAVHSFRKLNAFTCVAEGWLSHKSLELLYLVMVTALIPSRLLRSSPVVVSLGSRCVLGNGSIKGGDEGLFALLVGFEEEYFIQVDLIVLVGDKFGTEVKGGEGPDGVKHEQCNIGDEEGGREEEKVECLYNESWQY